MQRFHVAINQLCLSAREAMKGMDFNPTLINQYSGHVNIIRLLALENHFLYLNVWLIIKLPQLPAQSFLLEKKPRRRNHLVLLRQYILWTPGPCMFYI